MRPRHFLAVLSLIAVVGACRDGRSEPPPRKEAAPTVAPPQVEPVAEPRVVLRAPDGREVAVRSEIVATPAERQRGLMYRKTLDPDAGMLFLMGAEQPHRFWMKNTYVPLDMIWIGRDLRVVGVTENARPLTLDLRGIDAPSTYVLEVNAHFARRHGITPDWTVELPPEARAIEP